MKRIVIFCDGTWNTPDELENNKPCSTNVVKMAKALCPKSIDGVIQKFYYDTGVGVEGSKIKRLYEGATGVGIVNNIMQAYLYIIENYEIGDELFLFGFSRGAFTVRSLSGLIRNSGILDKKYTNKIDEAFALYHSRHPQYHPREIEATLFRKTFAVEDVTPIKFIGVWDTVGALGNPLILNGIVTRNNEFHNTGLSSKIQHAYQALAIDEKRKNFMPALWIQQENVPNQKLEQMWFCGVHSDIGGGYAESSLSDISLQWMLEKAKSCNLNFDNIEIHPDCLGYIHESRNGMYKLKCEYFREIDLPTKKGVTNEKIHPSVILRYKNDINYRPQNLVGYFNRNNFLLL